LTYSSVSRPPQWLPDRYKVVSQPFSAAKWCRCELVNSIEQPERTCSNGEFVRLRPFVRRRPFRRLSLLSSDWPVISQYVRIIVFFLACCGYLCSTTCQGAFGVFLTSKLETVHAHKRELMSTISLFGVHQCRSVRMPSRTGPMRGRRCSPSPEIWGPLRITDNSPLQHVLMFNISLILVGRREDKGQQKATTTNATPTHLVQS